MLDVVIRHKYYSSQCSTHNNYTTEGNQHVQELDSLLITPVLQRDRLLHTRSTEVIASVVSKADSMIHTKTRQAARASFDALCLAKEPPAALLHTACATFAQMIADMTGERCVILIGETPIAREK